jgi:hypothetical protein
MLENNMDYPYLVKSLSNMSIWKFENTGFTIKRHTPDNQINYPGLEDSEIGTVVRYRVFRAAGLTKKALRHVMANYADMDLKFLLLLMYRPSFFSTKVDVIEPELANEIAGTISPPEGRYPPAADIFRSYEDKKPNPRQYSVDYSLVNPDYKQEIIPEVGKLVMRRLASTEKGLNSIAEVNEVFGITIYNHTVINMINSHFTSKDLDIETKHRMSQFLAEAALNNILGGNRWYNPFNSGIYSHGNLLPENIPMLLDAIIILVRSICNHERIGDIDRRAILNGAESNMKNLFSDILENINTHCDNIFRLNHLPIPIDKSDLPAIVETIRKKMSTTQKY